MNECNKLTTILWSFKRIFKGVRLLRKLLLFVTFMSPSNIKSLHMQKPLV